MSERKHREIPGAITLRIGGLIKTRARSCDLCRKKKRKCDRKRPTCSFCAEHGFQCSYKVDDEKRRGSGVQFKPLPSVQTPAATVAAVASLLATNMGVVRQTPESRPSVNEMVNSAIDEPVRQSAVDLPNPVLLQPRYSAAGGSIVPIRSLMNEKVPSRPLDRMSIQSLSSPGDSGAFSPNKIDQLAAEASDLRRQSRSTAECLNVGQAQPPSSGFFPFHSQSPGANSGSSCSGSPGCYEVSTKDRKGSVFTNIINSALYNTAVSPKQDLHLLRSFVPSKRVCDELFHRYRTSIHTVIPLLDWEQLTRDYEMFWNDQSAIGIPFYINLFTVLYAASVSKYEEDCLDDSPAVLHADISEMNKFIGSAEIALSMYHFPRKITIEGLQASVILHSVLRNDCRTDDSGSVGTLIRLAQTIELHRDPLRFHHISDPKTIRQRRLLWWQLFYLDTMTSLSNRLMPIVVEDEYDTLYPSEYKKDLQGRMILDPMIAFTNGRFRWAECSNRIMRKGLSLKPMSAETHKVLSKEVENLTFYCSSRIQQILEPSNILPSQEQFSQFASSMLSTLGDRSYLLLFIAASREESETDENSLGDSPGYRKYEHVTLRPNAVDTSSVGNIRIYKVDEQLVERQVHLLAEFCRHGAMPKNKIFLWELRKFQPIQSLLALLRSLVLQAKQLQVEDDLPFFKQHDFAHDTKVTAVEDAISTLSYLSKHTTKLCRDRWHLVEDLKSATWTQFLLNPDTTMSEDSPSPGKEWFQMLEDLDKLQGVIDDNINMKIWDSKAGHFLV